MYNKPKRKNFTGNCGPVYMSEGQKQYMIIHPKVPDPKEY